MLNTKGNARIIESNSEGVLTRILCLNFPSKPDYSVLFVPKLENISFIFIENTLTISLKNSSLRDFFNLWTNEFVRVVNQADSSEKMIETFNAQIKNLLLLGQRKRDVSISDARGLFGELLVLKSLLMNNSISQSDILEGWHRPEPACHDFDFDDYSLEVKTTSRSFTTLRISSEDQLTSVDMKPLKLKLIVIQNLKKSKTDSLGEIYNEIRNILPLGLSVLFEMKCAEDFYFKYLGPEFMPIEYKFIVFDEYLYLVDQQNFPRIRKENLNLGISSVNYNLDLSSIEKFKIYE